MDETSFVPEAYLVNSADLNFTFSSTDPAPETITIRSGFYDGDQFLGSYSYALGNIWTLLFNDRRSTDLSIDLIDLNLAQYVEDGRFITLVLALENGCLPNDFRIDMANMTLEADPVPIPAGFWLLGSGLVALAGWRRKRK